MERKLNARQSKFIDEYMIDLNATQAAIRSGYSKKTAQEIGAQNLSKLMIASELKVRLSKAQERAGITLQDIINELDENRDAALKAETVQSSAATAATMAKAKLLGFVVDKVKMSGDSDNPLVVKSTIDMRLLSNETLAELIKAKDAINRS